MPIGIRKDIQLAVDNYVELYRDYKQLEQQVQELKKIIEPFMEETGATCIEASTGLGKVELVKQNRTTPSARYTTYQLEDIAEYLTPSLRKKCVVEVVDKEKIESLCKLGELTAEVLERKSTKEMVSFQTKLSKS